MAIEGWNWTEKNNILHLQSAWMTWKLFSKIECSHFQLCDYLGDGMNLNRRRERFKKVLILIIASIFVHNVITERTKQHVFVSNKLKSIEANESISLFRLSMLASYVTGSGQRICWLGEHFSCHRQIERLWLFMTDIGFYSLLLVLFG